MKNFNSLTRLLYTWPSVHQMNSIGAKHQLIFHLDIIAGTITHTFRPATKQLIPGDPIPANAVIKRSHSDCGQHVIMPDESGRDWESINQMPHVPDAIWFAQVYVPTLRTLGEWRVFIIGGHPAFVVHTRYNTDKSVWIRELVDTYYLLEEIGYVLH